MRHTMPTENILEDFEHPPVIGLYLIEVLSFFIHWNLYQSLLRYSFDPGHCFHPDFQEWCGMVHVLTYLHYLFTQWIIVYK